MPHARPLTAVGAAALVVLALAGCAGQADAGATPSPTTTATSAASAAAPTETPTPGSTPTESPAATVTIPDDCTQIVDTATYQATMGETPLNPEGFGRRDVSPRGTRTPSVPAAGADPIGVAAAVTELDCLWRDPRADVTGLSVQMGRLDLPTGDSLLQQAEQGGARCSEAHDGRLCQKTTVHEMYGTDHTVTQLVRGDLLIVVSQSNYPTDDLLGSILEHLSS